MSAEIAKALLASSGLSSKGRVRDAMQSTKWTTCPSGLSAGVHACFDARSNDVLVFPSAATSPTGADDVLKAFGQLVFATLSAKEREEWERKLVPAGRRQVESFSARLKDGESYRKVVESFGSAVDRLVAIHLGNALISNRVPIADARGFDLFQYGGTAQMANGTNLYSLTPLISAYCPHLADFPAAFAARAKGMQSSVMESSVRDALSGLIDRLLA